MMKKKLISVLLTLMIAVTFSVFILTPFLGSSGTTNYSTTNPYSLTLGASQVKANGVVSQQAPYTLNINFPLYYLQESGDLELFVVLASTPSGIVPGIAIGNGSSGWNAVPPDYWTPSISLNNINGNATLFVFAETLKNVWPMGYQTVDECFGSVGLFNPVTNTTSLPTLFTTNGNYHTILFFSVTASQ
jgi:hypothetical protein